MLTHASPAKPSRRYTEAERQAMLMASADGTAQEPAHCTEVTALNISAPLGVANSSAGSVEPNITPQQRVFLETSFPSVSEPLVDDVMDSSGYVIPSDDGDDCIQTLSWEFKPGGANYRIHKERLPARPTSFPPKPRVNMRFDMQTSMDASYHAPLATPETLSEASSLASVNSRSSWFGGGQYHKLSTEVGTLEPILQSPMRSRAGAQPPPLHNYDAFKVNTTSPLHQSVSQRMSSPINWSPVKYSTLSKAIKANSTRTADAAVGTAASVDRKAGGGVTSARPPRLQHARMTSVDSGSGASSSCRSLSTRSDSSKSTDERPAAVALQSPDASNQCVYDSVLGFYSPAGRGYPHGFRDKSSQYQAAAQSHTSEANTHMNGFDTSNGESSSAYEKTANVHSASYAADPLINCMDNAKDVADDLDCAHALLNGGTVPTANSRHSAVSPFFITPKIVFEFESESETYNDKSHCTCDFSERSTSQQESPCSSEVSTNRMACYNNDTHAYNNNCHANQSVGIYKCPTQENNRIRYENGLNHNDIEKQFDEATTYDDIRDDVSCDSEPFMPQTPGDLESPTTSQLCRIIHPSLFIQESQV